MNEYESLLEVRYALITDEPYNCYRRVYGTKQIPELYELVHGKNLVVALDQATNKTGMCFLDFDTNKVLAVLDLINPGFPSKQFYFNTLYSFIYNHIADESVSLFVYEIPIEHSKNARTLAVLEALRLFIRDFKACVPSLSKANMAEINVGCWRGHFLADDSKYKGRRKERKVAKEAAREEATCRAPELTNYFYRVNEPPDSCDAVGIAYGALAEIYVDAEHTIRRPNKTMPRKNIKFKQRIETTTPDRVVELLSTDFAFFSEAYELLEFNSEMTVEDNCRRYCGTTNRLGIIPIHDYKTAQELKWETGKELKPGEFYTVFCWRSS